MPGSLRPVLVTMNYDNYCRSAMEKQTLNFYNASIATSIDVPITFTLDGSILDFPNENDRGKETHICTVHNARETVKAPTLAYEGFQLFNHDIKFDDVSDDAQLESNVDLLQRFIQKQTGATSALFLGHVVRQENFDRHKPSTFVHADWSGERVQKLGVEDDPLILTNRDINSERVRHLIEEKDHWSIFNIWIPLKTVVNRPLALCDVHSVEHDDVVHNLRFKDPDSDRKAAKGNILSLKFRDHYRWFYYPLMQSNELLIFKQFDSVEGAASFIPVFHTAFKVVDDNDQRFPMRESIELRFLAAK